MRYNLEIANFESILMNGFTTMITAFVGGVVAVSVAYVGYILKKDYDDRQEFLSFKAEVVFKFADLTSIILHELDEGAYVYKKKFFRLEKVNQKKIIDALQTYYPHGVLDAHVRSLMRFNHFDEVFFDAYGDSINLIKRFFMMLKHEFSSEILANRYIKLMESMYLTVAMPNYKHRKEKIIGRLVSEYCAENNQSVDSYIQKINHLKHSHE